MTHRIFPQIALMTFVLILSACSTLRERADALLQEGKVDEGLALYESFALDVHASPEERAGLQRAREIWLDRKLLRVRLLRLGGNVQASEDLLRTVFAREQEWKLMPRGAVYATQLEELEEAMARWRSEIKLALSQDAVILAWSLWRRGQWLQEAAPTRQRTDALAKQLQERGVQYCHAWRARISQDQYYAERALLELCKVWNVDWLPFNKKDPVSKFRQLDWSFKLIGATDDSLKRTEALLSQNFSQSKWYSPESNRSLKMSLSGELKQAFSKKNASRVASYSVSVPYEHSYVRAKEEKENNVPLLFAVAALLFLPEPNERVEDNFDGTETVYEKRYREETRSFSYQVVEHQQKLQLNLKGQAMESDLHGDFAIQEEYLHQGDEHSTDFPRAGVEPEVFKPIPEQEWLLALAPQFTLKVDRLLTKMWEDRFCQPLNYRSQLNREEVFRCLYVEPTEVPASVNLWMKSEFGISPHEWQNLVLTSNSDSPH